MQIEDFKDLKKLAKHIVKNKLQNNRGSLLLFRKLNAESKINILWQQNYFVGNGLYLNIFQINKNNKPLYCVESNCIRRKTGYDYIAAQFNTNEKARDCLNYIRSMNIKAKSTRSYVAYYDNEPSNIFTFYGPDNLDIISARLIFYDEVKKGAKIIVPFISNIPITEIQ